MHCSFINVERLSRTHVLVVWNGIQIRHTLVCWNPLLMRDIKNNSNLITSLLRPLQVAVLPSTLPHGRKTEMACTLAHIVITVISTSLAQRGITCSIISQCSLCHLRGFHFLVPQPRPSQLSCFTNCVGGNYKRQIDERVNRDQKLEVYKFSPWTPTYPIADDHSGLWTPPATLSSLSRLKSHQKFIGFTIAEWSQHWKSKEECCNFSWSSMATQPGLWTDFPWQRMGNWKVRQAYGWTEHDKFWDRRIRRGRS